MRSYFTAFFLFLFHSLFSQECFIGKKHPLPELSEGTYNKYRSNLIRAMQAYDHDSTNADSIIWLGRREAYLGYYEDAIQTFSKGIILHPVDARFYRHRGHRYITLRCFDKAIADLEKAATLIKDKPDEIEPDGLPN